MEKHLSRAEFAFVRETMLRHENMYKEQVRELHRVYNVQKILLEEERNKRCGLSCPQDFLKLSTLGVAQPSKGYANYEFFPMKKEPDKSPPAEKTQPKRKFLFDLEKLPEEQPEAEFELAEAPAKTANEYQVNCTLPKRPRNQEEDTLRIVKPKSEPTDSPSLYYNQREPWRNQATQTQWLFQAEERTRKCSWNTGQPDVFLQQTNHASPWSQAPQPNECVRGTVGVRDFFSNYAEALKQDTRSRYSWDLAPGTNREFYPPVIFGDSWQAQSSWFGPQQGGYTSHQAPNFQQQQQQQQQQLYGVPASVHPWQNSGTGYFSSQGRLQKDIPSRHWLPGNYAFVGGLPITDAPKENFKALHNGEGSFSHDQVPYKNGIQYLKELLPVPCPRPIPEPGFYKAPMDGRGSLEARNGIQDEQGHVVDRISASQQKDGHVEKTIKHQEEDMTVEVAASILLRLSINKTSSRKAGPLAGNSMSCLADAIPCELRGTEKQSSTKPAELDHFESATLQLKGMETDCHPLIRAADATDTLLRSSSNNDGNCGSGRPSRRRRCKEKMDFQGETLPSIASLSRQEISEDLQIMGGLLRSTRETSSNEAAAVACSQRRGTKSSSSSGAKCSPVSTLDVARSPKRRGGVKLVEASSPLPCLISWGESRKRKQRQRGVAASQRLLIFSPGVGVASRCTRQR